MSIYRSAFEHIESFELIDESIKNGFDIDFYRILSRQNIPEWFVKKYLSKFDDLEDYIYYLLRWSSFSESFIEEYIVPIIQKYYSNKQSWYWYYIAFNQNVSLDFIKKYMGKMPVMAFLESHLIDTLPEYRERLPKIIELYNIYKDIVDYEFK